MILLGAEIGWMNHDGLLSSIGESEQELCERIPGVVDSGQTGQLAVEGKPPGRIARAEGVHLPPASIEIQLYVVLAETDTEAIGDRIAGDLVLDQRAWLATDVHVLAEVKTRKRSGLQTAEAQVPCIVRGGINNRRIRLQCAVAGRDAELIDERRRNVKGFAEAATA